MSHPIEIWCNYINPSEFFFLINIYPFVSAHRTKDVALCLRQYAIATRNGKPNTACPWPCPASKPEPAHANHTHTNPWCPKMHTPNARHPAFQSFLCSSSTISPSLYFLNNTPSLWRVAAEVSWILEIGIGFRRISKRVNRMSESTLRPDRYDASGQAVENRVGEMWAASVFPIATPDTVWLHRTGCCT